MKDSGVHFDCNLKLYHPINENVNNKSLMNRNFKCKSSEFVLCYIYKTLVRSQLEFVNHMWSSYRPVDIEKIEKVQMRATRMVEQMRNYSYEDRIRWSNLPTF